MALSEKIASVTDTQQHSVRFDRCTQCEKRLLTEVGYVDSSYTVIFET